MIQEDIYQVLSSDAGIRAIAGTRIYPVRIPRDVTLPAVVYRMAIGPLNTLQGVGATAKIELEVRCWSADYQTAHNLASAVRNAFSASTLKAILLSQADDDDPDTYNICQVLTFSIIATLT